MSFAAISVDLPNQICRGPLVTGGFWRFGGVWERPWPVAGACASAAAWESRSQFIIITHLPISNLHCPLFILDLSSNADLAPGTPSNRIHHLAPSSHPHRVSSVSSSSLDFLHQTSKYPSSSICYSHRPLWSTPQHMPTVSHTCVYIFQSALADSSCILLVAGCPVGLCSMTGFGLGS